MMVEPDMKKETMAKETGENDILVCMGGPKPYDARDFIEELIDGFTSPVEEKNDKD